ncbi:MAG: type II secretion system F family protein [Candidatus Pacebacteria bacterium]|nr:type II secretion system F family protein [Candidatus Paceibacterota bacterium]MCF7857466.1 type II secretion system F family protein [Candidatus Paceibacterota bacterium]
MSKFTYSGTTKDGVKVSEIVEAADKYAVYDIARTNGHVVTGVSEVKEFSFTGIMNMEKINTFLSRVKPDEVVMLTRNISSMLKAGLPLTRALSVIERQTTNFKLKQVMKDVRADINKGKQLNEALSEFPKIFSDLYIAMVRAGEEGGQLSGSLETLSLQMERSSTLKKKIKGAMIYPSIVLGVMVIIGALMMIYVVPSITMTFKSTNIELPQTTKILIATSDLMSNHSILVLLIIVGGIAGVRAFLKTNFGKKIFHFSLTRLPVIGTIVKEINSAHTARSLSSLLKAGVDVISAIKISEDVVQNVYYKAVLHEAATRVEKGTPLSEVFIERTDLYPVLVGEMISVGEETGQISGMLDELALFYETEVDQKTKDLSTIIEPLLMVVIGSGVGFFALAMIAPIYSISDSIN